MANLVIRGERCKGCGLCIHACQRKILAFGESVNATGYPVVTLSDAAACTGCALCAQMCPDLVFEVWK